MTDSILTSVANQLGISVPVVNAIAKLNSEGATVPFISRYRKEATHGADEVLVQQVIDTIVKAEEFINRKAFIIAKIKSANAFTDKIAHQIETATSVSELEDIYLPYKPSKKSKAEKALALGLKPLAIFIQQNVSDSKIEDYAHRFVGEKVNTEKVALEGAVSILAEWFAQSSYVVKNMRYQFDRFAMVKAKVKRGKKEDGEKFQDYFDFAERVDRIKAHRVLALFRGEKLGFLNVKITVDQEKAQHQIARGLGRKLVNNLYTDKAIKEAYSRVLQPYFESEIKKELRLAADEKSIAVFADNLQQLLMQAPLGKKVVMGIDPGFRTGCKAVILDAFGEYKEHSTLFPHPPKPQLNEASNWVTQMVKKYHVEAIAIGNGTAGKETKAWVKQVLGNQVNIYFVNEDGASIYSASEIARKEFADLDLTVRGAISIGRRLLDPLAELVKIDAKSIGVGQYQHDVNQPLLKKKLNEVVERCVNQVGVDVNLASAELLTHVSGLGPTVANNILNYRRMNGKINSRKELLKVPKLGTKAFEQCAGFLRIENGTNVLDNTIIHPEMYAVVKQVAVVEKCNVEDLFKHGTVASATKAHFEQLHGSANMKLIWSQIANKNQTDPRPTIAEQKENQINDITELYEGMQLHGVVINITNFGAFVDVGIKERGLIHISEIANHFVSDINEVVKLNQEVRVTVIGLDLGKKRIQLSLKS